MSLLGNSLGWLLITRGIYSLADYHYMFTSGFLITPVNAASELGCNRSTPTQTCRKTRSEQRSEKRKLENENMGREWTLK